MRSSKRNLAGAMLALALGISLSACKKAPEAPIPTGKVDEARLANIDAEPGQWLTSGRDAGMTHFSPLTLIERDNVSKVGFAWEYQTGTNRGMQATPIVVDGVMYTSGVAGRVYALDATNGNLLWQFEPPLKLKNARGSCCDIVNRGVAVWNGKVYVGSFEGILYALDARDGKVLWQADTFIDKTRAYSITGVPQVAGSVVVIGNGGAEFDSRGYVSAYNLDSGELAWRFFTTPTDPAKPQDNPALEMAVKTWDPKRDWGYGGGGNAWDGFAYDAKTSLVYFGTANGSPWNIRYRSPAGGENLFLASIVALHADTGEYAWHYQQTPGERWDYDATPKLMLATSEDRRCGPRSADAGLQEWLLLRAGSGHRRIAGGRQVRRCQLGQRGGSEDRQTRHQSGRGLHQWQARHRVSVGRGRAQLQSDVAVGQHRAGVSGRCAQRHADCAVPADTARTGRHGWRIPGGLRYRAAGSGNAGAGVQAAGRSGLSEDRAQPRCACLAEGLGSGRAQGGVGAQVPVVQ